MTNKSRHIFKHLKNMKTFYVEIKRTFRHFKRAFGCQNYLRLESAPLIIARAKVIMALFN